MLCSPTPTACTAYVSCSRVHTNRVHYTHISNVACCPRAWSCSDYHVLHSTTRFLSFRAVLSLSFALCTSVPPLRCTFAFRATLSITFCSLNSSLRCRIVVFCTPRYVVAHTPHLCRQLCRLYSATPPHSRSAPAFSHSALRCRSHSEPLVPSPAFRCIVGSAPALCVRIRGDHCSCSLKVSHSPAVTAHVMINSTASALPGAARSPRSMVTIPLFKVGPVFTAASVCPWVLTTVS